jgi:sucrose phosphorylase
VMADVIVNHLSAASPQYLDWSAKGRASPYDGLFLTLDKVFPGGATEQGLAAVYRPRPGLPLTPVTLANGDKRVLWTTFTPQQVDIDVFHPEGRRYLDAILARLAGAGVTMIRLDAAGYAVKKAGHSCFMMPETFDFIADFTTRARALGMEVLVEIHSYFRTQIEIAARVDRVYDFALPPLLLHALFFRTPQHLVEWLRIRPVNALTVLDTHDGIGIIDIGADPADRTGRPGLVPPAELDRLVEMIHERSGGASLLATGAAASNLDLYQVNCTFYDALGRDDDQYLLARALQFFVPGVPQVYYVGLLAGHNDVALLEQTGVGRDINRHRYDAADIDAQLQRTVVQRLLALVRLRSTHPAFGGEFTWGLAAADRLRLEWRSGADYAELEADFTSLTYTIRHSAQPLAA